jgi:hypothetical protein
MATGATNIKIEPVNVSWEMEGEELLSMSGVSDPDATEFNLFKVDGTKVRAIFDLDNLSVIPAAGAGEIVIELDVATGDTETQIATKVAAALDADGDLTATSSGTNVTVSRVAIGEVTDAADVDSGVGITICRRGKDFDLGLLEGDVELSFSPANFIVQAHQSGVTPRAALNQGIDTLEVSLTMQETQNANLKEIYKIYGGVFTPGAGTEVFGVGTSRQGNNLLIDAGRLVLRPVNAADATTDKNLMLAIPIPDSLVFSGENPRTLSITWQGFLDDSKDNRVSALLFGDATQTGI